MKTHQPQHDMRRASEQLQHVDSMQRNNDSESTQIEAHDKHWTTERVFGSRARARGRVAPPRVRQPRSRKRTSSPTIVRLVRRGRESALDRSDSSLAKGWPNLIKDQQLDRSDFAQGSRVYPAYVDSQIMPKGRGSSDVPRYGARGGVEDGWATLIANC